MRYAKIENGSCNTNLPTVGVSVVTVTDFETPTQEDNGAIEGVVLFGQSLVVN